VEEAEEALRLCSEYLGHLLPVSLVEAGLVVMVVVVVVEEEVGKSEATELALRPS
jgi:hypothetical protein